MDPHRYSRAYSRLLPRADTRFAKIATIAGT
jgi:hypothetical protein